MFRHKPQHDNRCISAAGALLFGATIITAPAACMQPRGQPPPGQRGFFHSTHVWPTTQCLCRGTCCCQVQVLQPQGHVPTTRHRVQPNHDAHTIDFTSGGTCPALAQQQQRHSHSTSRCAGLRGASMTLTEKIVFSAQSITALEHYRNSCNCCSIRCITLKNMHKRARQHPQQPATAPSTALLLPRPRQPCTPLAKPDGHAEDCSQVQRKNVTI